MLLFINLVSIVYFLGSGNECFNVSTETGRRQFQSSSHQATSDFGAALDDVESLLNGRTSDMIELALI